MRPHADASTSNPKALAVFRFLEAAGWSGGWIAFLPMKGFSHEG